MKTPEEYLDELCPMFVNNDIETLYFHEDILELMKQVQIDTYNEALEDAVENVVEFHNNRFRGYPYTINKESILKLKK